MSARTDFRFAALSAAAALALALPAAAAGDTLLEAMAKAYAANPQLEAERARLRAADEGVPQALSGWRPTVTARGSAGYGPVPEQEAVGAAGHQGKVQRKHRIAQPGERAHRSDAGRSMTGERRTARLRAAKHRVSAQRARLLSVEQTVFLSTGLALYGCGPRPGRWSS